MKNKYLRVNNARILRLQRGFARAAFARAAGVSDKTLQNIEEDKGIPKEHNAWSIVNALNAAKPVTFKEVFGDFEIVDGVRNANEPSVA